MWRGFCYKFRGEYDSERKSANICQSYEQMYSGVVVLLTVY